jgi:hypothetical protein
VKLFGRIRHRIYVRKDWNYHATENVKRLLVLPGPDSNDTYKLFNGHGFIRHVTKHRENIPGRTDAQWGGPGIYFMGRMENQFDRVFLPTLNEMFGFHKTNEKLFTNVESLGKVGLIMGSSQEYRGIMKLLTEGHIMYDLIQASAVGSANAPRKLEDYDVLILSNITTMDENFISIIDNYVNNGGKIMVTGFPGTNIGGGTPVNQIRLQSLGVMPDFEMFPRTQSTYLKVMENEKNDLGQEKFKDFDLIMMNSDF